MQITLDADESALLRNILERHLGDLRMEIGKTEKYEMRQEMKRDEETLKAIIARLPS